MGLADYLILAVILLLVFFAIRYIIRKKSSGCSGCSGGCRSCAHRTPSYGQKTPVQKK